MWSQLLFGGPGEVAGVDIDVYFGDVEAYLYIIGHLALLCGVYAVRGVHEDYVDGVAAQRWR